MCVCVGGGGGGGGGAAGWGSNTVHAWNYLLTSSSFPPSFLLLQETQRLIQEPVPGISAIPDEQNARYFHVHVDGPKDVR